MNLYDEFNKLNLKYPCRELISAPTEGKAKRYIKKYFDNRGKSEAFNLALTDGQLNEGDILSKSLHTLSAFLLGINLKELVEIKLKNTIIKYFPLWNEYSFEYSWFLTCLYHDCMAGVEKKPSVNNEEDIQLRDILKQKRPKFTYTIYENNLETYDLPNLHYTFDEDTINKYFRYRKQEMNSIDHGILGGYILFDKMVWNYERQHSLAKKKNETLNNGYFYTIKNNRNLKWRKEHLWHFGYVANAIIAHNIWFIKEGSLDEAKYVEYELEDLISGSQRDNRIRIENDPLLFFLALIDTIEPVKYYWNLKPVFVWKNISINYHKEENQIIIVANKDCFDMKKWYKAKFSDLSTWLYIRCVELLKDKEIIISL